MTPLEALFTLGAPFPCQTPWLQWASLACRPVVGRPVPSPLFPPIPHPISPHSPFASPSRSRASIGFNWLLPCFSEASPGLVESVPWASQRERATHTHKHTHTHTTHTTHTQKTKHTHTHTPHTHTHHTHNTHTHTHTTHSHTLQTKNAVFEARGVLGQAAAPLGPYWGGSGRPLPLSGKENRKPL